MCYASINRDLSFVHFHTVYIRTYILYTIYTLPWFYNRSSAMLWSTVTSPSYISIQFIYVYIYLYTLYTLPSFYVSEVNVLRFDQLWPLILTFSYSLYSCAYILIYLMYSTNILSEVKCYASINRDLSFLPLDDYSRRLIIEARLISPLQAGQDLHHLTMLGIALCRRKQFLHFSLKSNW